jgi:protein-disulfide isomerase
MAAKQRFPLPKLPTKEALVPILFILLAVAAFFIGSLYTKVQYLEKGGTAQVAGNQPAQPAAPAPGQKVAVDAGHFPVKGNKDAKVKDYVDTGKVKIAFRHYAFLGPASVVASNAAECANEQGKFWEMHDYLYKNQPPETDTSMYTTEKMSAAAGTLGMDTAKFTSCMTSNKYDKNVSDDFTAGQTAGVNGTPTFYVNGIQLVGAQPYSAFKQTIDAELAK